eukprot:14938306-Alexandrium_andersonii.AAC.1
MCIRDSQAPYPVSVAVKDLVLLEGAGECVPEARAVAGDGLQLELVSPVGLLLLLLGGRSRGRTLLRAA